MKAALIWRAPDDGLEVGGDDALLNLQKKRILIRLATDMRRIRFCPRPERTSSGGGFIPLLIGGVVAGVIGMGSRHTIPLVMERDMFNWPRKRIK
jgi:hypothetical protein